MQFSAFELCGIGLPQVDNSRGCSALMLCQRFKGRQAGFRYPQKTGTEIVFTDDPAYVLKTAREFLASQPVLHNLVLSLLHARIAHPEPGHYWLATEQDKVVGVVFQSELSKLATKPACGLP
jgi:hypothetical protein